MDGRSAGENTENIHDRYRKYVDDHDVLKPEAVHDVERAVEEEQERQCQVH